MKLSDIKHLSESLSGPPSLELQEKATKILIELGYDPNNFYQELEMDSNYVDTHQDTSYSNSILQLHSHSFFELLYCRNTCDVEYLVGSKRYRLQKGDIVMIPPGISHRPILPEHLNEPYIRDILWLSEDFIKLVANLFNDPIQKENEAYLFRTLNTKWEFLGDYFHKGVLENEHKSNGYEAAIIGNTISLLTHLKRALLDEEILPLYEEKIELFDQITSYIEHNYDKKITLLDISNEFYTSETTINLLFKKKIGTTFHRYITQRRLISAKSLISEGVPLELIAEKVGYADYSTFFRSFKQEFGISPRQYRKIQEK